MVNIVNKARAYALRAHDGQLDDSGRSFYHSHPRVVGHIVSLLTDDVDVIAAAYLHDVIEDTKATYNDLFFSFGQRIADLVMEVTHDGEKDSYGYFFPRLKSKEAILIKLVDRASNVSRMDCWSKARQFEYLKKTKFWKDGSDKADFSINKKKEVNK